MLKIEDNNIYLTRGDTAFIDILITDEDGQAYTMDADDRVIFTLRKLYDKGSVLLEKTSSTPEIGFSTNDTKNLEFGDYKFDIYLFNSNTQTLDTFIADRIFTVGEEAHELT